MGDPSNLRLVPASSSAIPIDWTRVPEVVKKFLVEHYGYKWVKADFEHLPATIGDLANMFDETKFFGYFNSSLDVVLMDISEFGLQPTPSNGQERPVGPRFYMSHCGQLWFLLFAPGTRDCILGYNNDIVEDTISDDDDDDDDEAYYEKVEVEEARIAKAFDIQLEQKVSQGREKMVESQMELGGWTAWMLPHRHRTRVF